MATPTSGGEAGHNPREQHAWETGYDEYGSRPAATRERKIMQPTRPLMAEHQTILHMMADIVRKLKVFRETERVDTRYVDTAIDFIRTYADGCHHGKEEGI